MKIINALIERRQSYVFLDPYLYEPLVYLHLPSLLHHVEALVGNLVEVGVGNLVEPLEDGLEGGALVAVVLPAVCKCDSRIQRFAFGIFLVVLIFYHVEFSLLFIYLCTI